MSWLSNLKYSNRLEHLYAMIAGDEELDESVPSTYDRKQGFLFKIAQKIAELSEGGGSGGGADIEATAGENDALVVNMTADELADAMQKGARIYITVPGGIGLGGTITPAKTTYYYLEGVDSGVEKTIKVFSAFADSVIIYVGTEQDGKTVFSAS